MNDTRLIREIKDRLTIIAFALSIASTAIVVLAVMAAVWFWRVEELRQRADQAVMREYDRVQEQAEVVKRSARSQPR